jgi:hypothetical protein
MSFHLVGEPQGLENKHLFSGGFLGLDNIGVFDRSKPYTAGGSSKPAAPRGWHATTMMSIALELARTIRPQRTCISSSDTSSRSPTVAALGGATWTGGRLFYDQLHVDGRSTP